ncbi:uncharacterized protein LOC128881769 isoform X1 [Hylaeus volcanicus]|uniref:uncharacterized protein LOC128881769 isoform X1 n=2 Tax=Hylaeus volcanicus TaxID=313075 RepID=UPI0023B80110|nr:uncharacterized protein LOC128881769 isoform X1 [Hylaeus volcanicus]
MFVASDERHRSRSSVCNLPDAIRGSYSPIVEDLLKEMNETKLRKFNENDNDGNDCYRCKHFLNIPQNLIKACEELSDCTEEYEADLIFVQAVVWLKSATTFMKDISIEQFHLIFHKQWNLMEIHRNRRNATRKDFESLNLHTIPKFLLEELHCDFLDSPKPFDTSKKSFDSDLEYANSIDLVSNITWNRNSQLSHCDTKQDDTDFIKCCTDLSIFVSRTSEIHVQSACSLITDKSTTSDKSIIPESDREYSSCSDIFKDSLESEEINNAAENKNEKSVERNEFIVGVSMEDSLVATRATDPSSIRSEFEDEWNRNDSDVTMFDNDYSLSRNNDNKLTSESSSQSIIQCTNESDSYPRKKNVLIPPKQVNKVINNSSFLKDSAYDTYPLSGVRCVIKNDDTIVLSNGEIDNTVVYQSAISLDCFTMPNENYLSDGKQQSWLSSLKLTLDQENERTDSFMIEPSQRNVERQEHKDFEEDVKLMEPHAKRIKLEWVNETDRMVETNTEERKEGTISSKWLRFTLDALSIDEVAFQSVKVILLMLQDERIAKQYTKKRFWSNTLESEAVNAIVNFCDVFEAEKRSNACTQEIVQTITDTLEKIIGNSELNKVTILIHQTSIILELCTSMKVCIDVINYLTAKLKSQESILVSLMNSKKAHVHTIVNQLHITFYALTFCLKKYRSVFCNKDKSQLEEEMIPPVIDLWKKQLPFENAIIEDNVQKREQRWLTILNDFTVIAANDFTQFTENSRRLIGILTCK